MDPGDIQQGYVYAASPRGDADPLTLRPLLAVDYDGELWFVPVERAGIDPSDDGPHPISQHTRQIAATEGRRVDADDIWSLWGQRRDAEEVMALLATDQLLVGDTAAPSIIAEAERILRESATPDGQASSWLRNCEHWPGSSMSVLYGKNGEIAGAFVSVFTENPYKLRALLRWLGMDKEMIARVTGLER